MGSLIEIAFAFFVLLASYGAGQAALHRLKYTTTNFLENLSFSVALGLGILVLLGLALGLAHVLYSASIYLILGVTVALGRRHLLPILSQFKDSTSHIRFEYRSIYPWLILLVGAGLLLGLIRALAPPHGSTDPLAYQLALPKIFLKKHFLSYEPTITGAMYPSNMGLLYAFALGLRNGILAQVFHWMMGALSLVALVGLCQRYFSKQVGIWAAAIFGFTPVFVAFSPLGYIDVGLCYFQLMAFWALFNWVQSPNSKALLVAGVLTGLAMGVKHQGIPTLAIGFLCITLTCWSRRESFNKTVSAVVIYLSVAIFLVAPWYARSYFMAGNPIWPLANSFFDGFPFSTPPAVLVNTSGDPDVGGIGYLLPSIGWIKAFWERMSPWEWTFSPRGWQEAIGIYFVALIPGCFLYVRKKAELLLVGFCLVYYLVLIRILHMNPRYGLVLFALLSILCGHVITGLLRSRMVVIRHIFCVAFCVTALFNISWAFAMAKPVTDVVLGRETRVKFLQNREANYRAFEFANSRLPAKAKVLLQGIVKGYYCERDYLWDHSYQGVLRYEKYSEPVQLLKKLGDLEITHVVRMIKIPRGRLGYFPQYFLHPFHESFRKRYLRLLYRDDYFVVFEIVYPDDLKAGKSPESSI